jgi:hypothetical protein
VTGQKRAACAPSGGRQAVHSAAVQDLKLRQGRAGGQLVGVQDAADAGQQQRRLSAAAPIAGTIVAAAAATVLDKAQSRHVAHGGVFGDAARHRVQRLPAA